MQNYYYVVKEQSGQFLENEIYEGCTRVQNSQRAIKIKRFKSSEEALAFLANYQREIKFYPNCGGALYHVTEYFVEANQYDENGNVLATKVIAYAKA